MAVMVTEQVQNVVGVPVMAPVPDAMANPAGRPDWVHVSVAVDDVSVAIGVRVEMALPLLDRWAAMAVTATVLVMVQVKATEFEALVLSVAVTVTEHEHAVVGVPLMMPVAEAMVTPAGRPVADQVSVGVGTVWESVAVAVIGVMAVPDTFDLAVVVGLVTATVLGLVMVQVNADVETALAKLSVAVSVTEQVHAVVGVPVMAPVEELMASPAGRPDWVQVRAFEVSVE